MMEKNANNEKQTGCCQPPCGCGTAKNEQPCCPRETGTCC